MFTKISSKSLKRKDIPQAGVFRGLPPHTAASSWTPYIESSMLTWHQLYLGHMPKVVCVTVSQHPVVHIKYKYMKMLDFGVRNFYYIC